jgi:DNA-binding protein WhiA
VTRARVTFSGRVRRELVERAPPRPCCRRALLSALVRHAGARAQGAPGDAAGIRVRIGEPAAARLALALVRGAGVEAELPGRTRRRRRARLVLVLHGERAAQLLHEAGILSAALEPLAAPPARVVGRRCCRAAYVRGAIVAAGWVASPRAPAQVELRAPTLATAEALVELARRDGIALRAVARRRHALAYAKRRETVRDLLALAGAHDAVLSFEEAELIGRTRERANRLTNCDAANVARLAGAARRQQEAIALLDLEALDGRLRAVAELRLRHPDLSLAELGRRAEPPRSKSAVARDMRKLCALTTR